MATDQTYQTAVPRSRLVQRQWRVSRVVCRPRYRRELAGTTVLVYRPREPKTQGEHTQDRCQGVVARRSATALPGTGREAAFWSAVAARVADRRSDSPVEVRRRTECDRAAQHAGMDRWGLKRLSFAAIVKNLLILSWLLRPCHSEYTVP